MRPSQRAPHRLSQPTAFRYSNCVRTGLLTPLALAYCLLELPAPAPLPATAATRPILLHPRQPPSARMRPCIALSNQLPSHIHACRTMVSSNCTPCTFPPSQQRPLQPQLPPLTSAPTIPHNALVISSHTAPLFRELRSQMLSTHFPVYIYRAASTVPLQCQFPFYPSLPPSFPHDLDSLISLAAPHAEPHSHAEPRVSSLTLFYNCRRCPCRAHPARLPQLPLKRPPTAVGVRPPLSG